MRGARGRFRLAAGMTEREVGLPLYVGLPHPCGYLEGREARMAFVPPELAVDRSLYTLLVANGFRRSGELVYRPHCPGCEACVPVRIPVRWFRPNRSQRRVARRNAHLTATVLPPVFRAEHYRLYTRYLDARHADGEMAGASPEDFMRFLGNQRWEGTRFVEFRADETLLAVAVVDELEDGLSAVYTFYEPSAEHLSLGTWAILWMVAEAGRRGQAHVYLGFWVRDCPKMAYKSGFRPLERLADGGWERLHPG